MKSVNESYLSLLPALLVLACLSTVPTSSWAANRDVCSLCQYKTIDSAIAAAQSGDKIRIAAGVYSEEISLNGSKSLVIEGGYSQDFGRRDFDGLASTLSGLTVSYYNQGDIVIDVLTISGRTTPGIVVWSATTSVTIKNCRIKDNLSSGIYVMASKEILIQGNIVTGNQDPTGQYTTAGIYITDSTHSRAEVLDNVVSESICRFCFGIVGYSIGSNDVFSRNEVHHNSTGISITAANSSRTPLIEWNESHDNLLDGMGIWGSSGVVRHNLSYNNGGMGMTAVMPAALVILNNVFANNANHGLSLSSFLQGTVQPVIRGNVFAWNAHGLNISGSSGWGPTSIYPTVEYNDFFSNTYGEMIHSVEYPWSFEDETPGAYGALNSPSWSNYNVVHDPGFVDPEHGDFSLRPDSFLIDEGAPSDDFDAEPLPNGGRINIGLYGNSPQAEVSLARPMIRNISAMLSGDDVLISFDAAPSSKSNWVTLEADSGSGFVPVPAGTLSGEFVSLGDRGARIQTGANRSLVWSNAISVIGQSSGPVDVRLTLRHGNETDSESATVCMDCARTTEEEPVSTPAPTAAPTPVPTPQPTVQPSPTPTIVPTIPTQNEKKPTVKPTRTPLPLRSIPKRQITPKPRTTPKPIVTVRPRPTSPSRKGSSRARSQTSR